MHKRTGGCLADRRGKTCGAALGNDDSVRTRALGTSDYCTEVMRILKSVANNDEGTLAKRLCVGEDLLDRRLLGLGCHGYDTLVLCTA